MKLCVSDRGRVEAQFSLTPISMLLNSQLYFGQYMRWSSTHVCPKYLNKVFSFPLVTRSTCLGDRLWMGWMMASARTEFCCEVLGLWSYYMNGKWGALPTQSLVIAFTVVRCAEIIPSLVSIAQVHPDQPAFPLIETTVTYNDHNSTSSTVGEFVSRMRSLWKRKSPGKLCKNTNSEPHPWIHVYSGAKILKIGWVRNQCFKTLVLH